MSTDSQNLPQRAIGLSDAVAIIVGTVIGAGIYETTPLMAASTTGPVAMVALFAIGGVCALIGAACYAELGGRINRSGGDFEFLLAAYGSRTAFLFAWMTFWIVQPASLGAIAYIFARYAAALHPLLQTSHFAPLAAAAIACLSAANLIGLQSGTAAQKFLTALKVAGVLCLVLMGFVLSTPKEVSPAPIGEANWKLAFILVMYTYGGWNVIVMLGGELRDVKRNLLRSLMLGLGVTATIYITAVIAFERALGHQALAQTQSAAADVAAIALGESAAIFISVLICVTCLANINATLLTNSRVFYALGRRWPVFAWLGRWDSAQAAPVNALVAQALISIVLIFLLEAGGDSFQRLVVFSAPVFWVFFLLVSFALFILRRRGDTAVATFRVPFYPFLPMVFSAICGFMLYASIEYALQSLRSEAIAVAVVFAVGLLASFLTKART